MTGWPLTAGAAADAGECMKSSTRLLGPAENARTKALYRKIFEQDSQAFVEYYYHYKTRENRIYAAEDEEKAILSMLHLNPYLMKLGAQECLGEYIVAVATEERYRHRGLMRNLLKMSLEDMRRMGEPLAFLIPAAEAIYRPFGFRFIYSQRQGEMRTKAYAGKPHLICRAAEKEDLGPLAEFANEYLKRNYAVFAFHTAEYLETLLAEQRCQKGEIVLLLEEERIRGYFFTAFDEGPEVREPVVEEGYEKFLLPSVAEYLRNYEKVMLYGLPEQIPEGKKEKPLIMARITNPEWFAAGLTARKPVALIFELLDEFLPENSGIYRFSADESGGSMKKCAGSEAEFTISISDFTALVFGSISSRDAGLPEKQARIWENVNVCAPVFLNEVV